MNLLKTALNYVRREFWTVLMLAVIVAALVWQGVAMAPTKPAPSADSAPSVPVSQLVSPSSPPSSPASEPAQATQATQPTQASQARPADASEQTQIGDPHSEAERLETARKIEALEAKILKDPKLQMKVGIVVILILGLGLLGLVWGVLFLLSVRRGEMWMERFGSPRTPWGLNEAFKAMVLMFFLDLVLSAGFSYVFSLLGADTTNLALMTGILARSILMIGYLGWVARKRGIGWSDLGLCPNRPWKQVLWGLAGYLAMIPVYLLVLAVLVVVLKFFHIETPVQTPVQILYTESNTAAVMAFVFFMGILGPWFEEILFRGFVYPAFRARMGVRFGILASSVLFAALHGHGIAFAPILVLGLALHLLYERSGSVIPGAVLHMTHNSAMLLLTLGIRQLAP